MFTECWAAGGRLLLTKEAKLYKDVSSSILRGLGVAFVLVMYDEIKKFLYIIS